MLQTLHISYFLTLPHSTIWWKFKLRHIVFMAINYFVTRHDIRYQYYRTTAEHSHRRSQAVFPTGDRTTAEHSYRRSHRLCSQLAIAQLQSTPTGAVTGCVPNWRSHNCRALPQAQLQAVSRTGDRTTPRFTDLPKSELTQARFLCTYQSHSRTKMGVF